MLVLEEFRLSIESGRNIISIQCQLPERERVIKALCQEMIARKIPCCIWNSGLGTFRRVGSSCDSEFKATSALEVVEKIANYSEDCCFILEDLHSFLHEPDRDIRSRVAAERMRSQLINFTFTCADTRKYVVLLGTQEIELPPILNSIIPEFLQELPHYEEIVALLKEVLPKLAMSADILQLALSAGGLSIEEIKTGLRLVKAQGKPLIQGLLDFKIQRLRAFNLSFTPHPNVGNFGGMDRIREGIIGIKKDYTNEARKQGIPLPKGWLLVGPPGTGKTFVSKFCAAILEFPMISVDTGAIASGGASYLRRLIDRIEASAPAVVYFDELDKLFPDLGQSADMQQRQVLGFLLTWLQDKVSQTFVIATLNRLDSLPPELTRLGRFDEIFYVGFPQNGERKDILHLHLARFDSRYKDGNSPMSEKDWRVLINQTVNFTGAELSTMVEKAARRLFHQGKEIQINLEEMLAIRQEIIPLFARDTDRILKIENIAKGVATPCSSPDVSIYAPPLTTLWGKKEVN